MIINFEEHEFENPEFIELLNQKEILGREEGEGMIRKFHKNAMSVLIYLVQRGDTVKEELCRLWGDSIDFAYVNIEKTLFQPSIVEMVPEKFARQYKVIPIYKLGDAITVAAADPANRVIMERVENIVRARVSPVFSFPHDIEDAIEIEYKTRNILNDYSRQISAELLLAREAGKATIEDIRELASKDAVVEFTRSLLLLGVKERASSIHIDPGDDVVRIRFRIEGLLQNIMELEKSLLATIVSRLKVLAGADTGETRKPQKGKIYLSMLNKVIDLKFSGTPTIYGERIVIRIVGGGQMKDVPDLSELYFSKNICNRLSRLITYPNGIFFVTGPPESGKSTTLYSAIKHINSPEKNIVSIEDVIEYRVDGVSQIQLNPGVELDFSSALSSVLDQDPDVILVGKIRDDETAKKAICAAMTGCLVLTTLYANNALQTISRLIEIGADPFLLAPSVIGVMAQRLVRQLCHCKEKYLLSPDEIRKMFIWDGKTKVFFYRAKGCSHCKHTGFHGRIAIHELFLINHEIRRLITNNAPFADICESAVKAGFQSMHYDGIKKVLRGLTSIDEINRVVVPDG